MFAVAPVCRLTRGLYSVQLRVTYDGAAVAGGERLSVVQTAAKPQVAFEGAEPNGTPVKACAFACSLPDEHPSSLGTAFYTFMLVDPDAPDPAEPVRPAQQLLLLFACAAASSA